MSDFLIGGALGFLFVACVAAPFVAPWRMRIRYLVNAQVADPVFGVAPPSDVTMREVHMTWLAAERGHVDLTIDEAGGGPVHRPCAFTRDACPPGVIAMLDGWSATQVPLLLVVDENGHTHLYGPDGAITHLARAEERTR